MDLSPQRMAQKLHILCMINFHSAKTTKVGIHDLSVKKLVTLFFKMNYQAIKSHFGSIASPYKPPASSFPQ